ncbi:unnamed protein product [Dovyalis caffra]|uniref:Uncharacterized protein n=1 Tax=Dovyalis caffra TaxID=77055 RepID=A0AAV1RYT6_9ROSI|nr:unnamed protein product [Dovyalis caffra]
MSTHPTTPLSKPPAGFVVDNRGRIHLASTKQIVTIFDLIPWQQKKNKNRDEKLELGQGSSFSDRKIKQKSEGKKQKEEKILE